MITKNYKKIILTFTMLILTNSLLPFKKPTIKSFYNGIVNNYQVVSDSFLNPAISIAASSFFKSNGLDYFNQTISNSLSVNNYKDIKLLSSFGTQQIVKYLPLKKELTLGLSLGLQILIPKYLNRSFSEYSLTVAPIAAVIAISKIIYKNKFETTD